MIFVDACFNRPTPYTPIWMMRQAGRYLPQYMAVRSRAGDFLSLCHNPELAAEVTLQPVEFLDVDAAILFSDILVVPNEMGMELKFVKNEGPLFPKPLTGIDDIEALQMQAPRKLEYVYGTIRRTRSRLDDSKALIGFCGAPWTLATYMVEGKGSKSYATVKKMLYTQPQTMHRLLYKLTEVLIGYLENQIEAGANAVMIFDSWASALEKSAYLEFGWTYIKQIAAAIKKRHPEIPVICFPKGIPGFLDAIDGNFDVFGVDWSTPLELAKEKLGKQYVLQGNMEPCRLYDTLSIDEGIEEVLKVMGTGGGHIFNLGHGMLPDLPPENARYLVKRVHELSRR